MNKNLKNKKFIFVGGSGVGKSTLISMILKYYKVAPLHFSVSSTTREIRDGEIDGKHYNFESVASFLLMQEQELFAETNPYAGGDYYGTLKSQVEIPDVTILLDVDVNGAIQLKKLYPDAVIIFIAPPSEQELRNRLTLRGNTPLEKIEKRMKQYTEVEVHFAKEADYVVVNDILLNAFSDICSIMFQEMGGKIIAIDGPAKCGKGAISTAVAKPIDAHVVPTGDFFRYFGYKLRDDYSERDLKNIVEKFSYSEFDELQDELGTEKNGKKASSIASDPIVRNYVKLITIMYAYSNHGKKFIVYEGRDTTTRTGRFANFKFYITIDDEIRAKRVQLATTGSEDGWEFVWNDLKNRDLRDMNRKVDPLYHDIDNGVVGVSNNGTLHETVSHILEKHVYPKLKECTMYG